MSATCHEIYKCRVRKIQKITEAGLTWAALVMMAPIRLIRLTCLRFSILMRSASTNGSESQEIHRKLDRIESALNEIELALKEDDNRNQLQERSTAAGTRAEARDHELGNTFRPTRSGGLEPAFRKKTNLHTRAEAH